MKASEIADFFEFGIEKVEKEDISSFKDSVFVYGGEYNEKSFTGYKVYDLQGCFRDRYIDDIKMLAECFDSMLTDYIFDPFQDTLNDLGVAVLVDLERELNSCTDIKWVLDEYPNVKENFGSGFYDLISAFDDGELIEDDITPQGHIKDDFER